MPHTRTRGDIYISIRSRDLTLTSQQDYNNSGRFTLFENIINIVPSEPLTTRPKTADAAPLISSAPTVTTPIAPNVAPLGGTISPGDRSQLAKSGDIDITEALVNRG